jgi:hypothetical protein
MFRRKIMAVQNFTVESHFADKSPVLQAIYDRLLLETRKFGNVVEEPKKTSIHLVNKTAFAGVSTRKAVLLLNIKSAEPIIHARFPRNEKVSANRYHQELKLTDPAEVDAELLGWLRQAYELSA